MEKEERTFSSSERGENIIQKQDLIINEKSQREEKLFMCTDGDRNFNEREMFTGELKFQTGERAVSTSEGNKILCYERVSSRNGKKHDEQPLSCFQAEKYFNRKATIPQQRKMLKAESQYICTECSKSYKTKYNLIIHQRIHTGEKPFTCHECGESFSAKARLKDHQRLHTGVEPYTCTECGKSFRWGEAFPVVKADAISVAKILLREFIPRSDEFTPKKGFKGFPSQYGPVVPLWIVKIKFRYSLFNKVGNTLIP
ncbi:oocyte zinc finger protein XlCOF2-like [Rhinatrema bivittatum]|uniref:oocyte zinc finger protein XlCOF2-like n=1 Tax=Rhinatrema bivittatum TaxID=194408 RepID=UPI00112C891E|nr:oocyte zinc finger protein XlCOF2-like [Rhinatrema bivittatum]